MKQTLKDDRGWRASPSEVGVSIDAVEEPVPPTRSSCSASTLTVASWPAATSPMGEVVASGCQPVTQPASILPLTRSTASLGGRLGRRRAVRVRCVARGPLDLVCPGAR